MKEKKIVVIDAGNAREAGVTVGEDETIDSAIDRGYNELGEERRPNAHFVDGRGNSLDGRLDEPVRTIETDQDGNTTIEIRGPTGGACLFSSGVHWRGAC